MSGLGGGEQPGATKFEISMTQLAQLAECEAVESKPLHWQLAAIAQLHAFGRQLAGRIYADFFTRSLFSSVFASGLQ